MTEYEHRVVGEDEWLAARRELLDKEKALTRLRDEVAAERRQLPVRLVGEDYVFTGPHGDRQLADLFGRHSQLIVVHFMYGPGWDEGCKSCSFWADQYDALIPHLAARNVALAVVSRAPLQDFAAFKVRMGWQFDWYSSSGCSFSEDFNVSFPGQDRGVYNYSETNVMEEHPGISVFGRDQEGRVYHTYSLYSRGLDALNATYQLLDLVPDGRNEQALPFSMGWVRHHDRY